MKWFEGDIAEAVAISKKRGAIFVVYTEGQEENAKYLTEVIETTEVSQKLESEHFVAIKIEGGSIPFNQFSSIYKQACIPSIFFIGKSGSPLEVITEKLNSSQLAEKINGILHIHLGTPSTSLLNETPAEQNSPKPSTVVCDNDVCEVKSVEKAPTPEEEPAQHLVKETQSTGDVASVSASENSVSTQEKLDRAKKLIEAQQLAKQKEAEEKEKLKEMERRKEGKNMQQYKEWKQEQEMKNLKEEREKQKKEETEARQRILAQIAQDRADRASRFNSQQLPTSPPNVNQQSNSLGNSRPNLVPGDNTRLQFRLPDGSSNTHDFSNSATLQEVRQYVITNLNLPFRGFALSTTFPRREFGSDDNGRSLLDLELCPNAVILVLPVNQGVVAASHPGGLAAFLWSFLAPIINLLIPIKNWLLGRGAAQQPPPRSSAADGDGKATDAANVQQQERKRNSSSPDANSGSTMAKRRIPESTVIRRQGNVHRLSDKTDSDEENNTWNGNSTQQM